MRGRWLAAACAVAALGAMEAAAQESPELPARSQAATQAAPEPQLRFYKGKGPGRDNSYVERFEEDYAYLRNPAGSRDFFDPLKFIPLDAAGDVYLTLNGETRFRAGPGTSPIDPSAHFMPTPLRDAGLKSRRACGERDEVLALAGFNAH